MNRIAILLGAVILTATTAYCRGEEPSRHKQAETAIDQAGVYC